MSRDFKLSNREQQERNVPLEDRMISMVIGESGSRVMAAREGVNKVEDSPPHGINETNMLLSIIALRLGGIERLLQDQADSRQRILPAH